EVKVRGKTRKVSGRVYEVSRSRREPTRKPERCCLSTRKRGTGIRKPANSSVGTRKQTSGPFPHQTRLRRVNLLNRSRSGLGSGGRLQPSSSPCPPCPLL